MNDKLKEELLELLQFARNREEDRDRPNTFYIEWCDELTAQLREIPDEEVNRR